MASGIPQLLNGVNSAFGLGIEIRAIANLATRFFIADQPQWYIVKQGGTEPPVIFDGFVDFQRTRQSQVANYRIEQGQFSTYNKVNQPFTINMVGIKVGTQNDLSNMITTLEKIEQDINLYDIVTKDQIYQNCNLQGSSFRVSPNNGLNILYIPMTWTEILSTQESAFSAPTKTQAGKPVTSNGSVSPK